MKLSANKKIASIIGNEPLASDICNSINSALSSSLVHLTGGKNVWDIFKYSLDAAIRDIEERPRGKLFRRLIEYGPLNPNDPKALVSDGETFLSDPECGECVEFIYSHMINRFKGELAELLAMHPCVTLIQKLQQEKRLPSDIHLYWGETIQERRQYAVRIEEDNMRWSSIEKNGLNLWKITLAWSQEALSQAAYEMTFWYMSQVGAHVYVKNNMPKGWEYMTPEQAGCNSIKMMLYYIPLRYITKRQDRLATRLYNLYCFGYPLGADSKEMLWPEDFPSDDGKEMS